MDTKDQPKITPQLPSGNIPVGGQSVPISQGSVPTTNQGSASVDEFIKGLGKAADTGVFPLPPEQNQKNESSK